MTIDLTALIEQFGAAAIFLGAGFEGEAAVVTGGWLAARGVVHPWTAAACAFAGSLTVDQTIFAIGRRNRDAARIARLLAKPPARRATRLIERHPVVFCLVFRFLYGLRIAGPLAIGVSRIPVALFVALNLVSAAVWASVFTFVGYRYGQAALRFVARLITEHPWLTGGLATVALATVAWLLLRPEPE